MNIKTSQSGNFFDDTISSIGSSLGTPLGLGLGVLGIKHFWGGSPALKGAALAGLPYALYKYRHYSDQDNLLKAQTEADAKLLESVRGLKHSDLVSPSVVQSMQHNNLRSLMERYNAPARSALSDAVPFFAAGAALPTALKLMSR